MKSVLLAIGSSEIGGAQKVFFDTVLGLVKNGIDVIVVAPSGPLINELKPIVTKIYIVDYKIFNIYSIYKIIKNNNLYLINTFLSKCSIIFCIANFFNKIPICCTLLNSVQHEKLNFLQNRLYPYLYYPIKKIANLVITNSYSNKLHLEKVCGFRSSFVTVIYAGLNINKFINNEKKSFPINNSSIKVLILGRISIEKGHIYLLQALKLLENINLECWVVGDGQEIANLKNYVLENDMSHKIIFYGFRKDVADFMRRADIVVVPSINEAFGLTILEAFLMRVLVIGTNVGGIPELIKDLHTGILVSAKNPKDIANAIEYCLDKDNEEKVLEIINKAHNFCKDNFSISNMMRNTLSCYKSISPMANKQFEIQQED